MSQLFKVVASDFALEFGSNTRRPTGQYRHLEEGSIIEYESTAPNGNVWFNTDIGRGKYTSLGDVLDMTLHLRSIKGIERVIS